MIVAKACAVTGDFVQMILWQVSWEALVKLLLGGKEIH